MNDIVIREHRSAWYSLPENIRTLAMGGFDAVDEKVLLSSKDQALTYRENAGVPNIIEPCVLIITEAGERALLYAGNWAPSGSDDLCEYQNYLMDQILAISETCPNLKVTRKVWIVKPPRS